MKKIAFLLIIALVLSSTMCVQGAGFAKQDYTGKWYCNQMAMGFMQVSYILNIYSNDTACMSDADGSNPVELKLSEMTNGIALIDDYSMGVNISLADKNTLHMEYPILGTLVFVRLSNQPDPKSTPTPVPVRATATPQPTKNSGYTLILDTPYFYRNDFVLVNSMSGMINIYIEQPNGIRYTPDRLKNQVLVLDITDENLANRIGLKIANGLLVTNGAEGVSGFAAVLSLIDAQNGDVLDSVYVYYSSCYRDGWLNEKAYTSPIVTVSRLASVTSGYAYDIYNSYYGLQIDNVTYTYKNNKLKKFPNGYYHVEATFYNKSALNFGVAVYDSDNQQVGEMEFIGGYSPITPLARVAFEVGKGVWNIITDPGTFLAQFECETTNVALDVPLGGYIRIHTSADSDLVDAMNYVDYLFGYFDSVVDLLDGIGIAKEFVGSWNGKAFDVMKFAKAISENPELFGMLKEGISSLMEDGAKGFAKNFAASGNQANLNSLRQAAMDSIQDIGIYGIGETGINVAGDQLLKINPITGILSVATSLAGDVNTQTQLYNAMTNGKTTEIRYVFVPSVKE